MLHSEPNNWEIFKIPPVQPIQYFSILKAKREFSQLIKQYDAQVHGYHHYCSIVPKIISSSLYNEYELLIVFLGDVPTTSFIGFRVNVNSETFIHESNSLLLFLKQSKKAKLYFVSNNCIHVQCGKDAWEIFYHLYGIYLRKYVLTVIGTQFFYHFVYQLCIQNEKQLLNLLFKGSKVIRVSKMSIYYRIHRKRKISVTDLIHMTINMPESKRYVISFDSKESLAHSNIVNGNIYTAAGSKIHVSKLTINKFKENYQDSLLDNKYNEDIPPDNVPSSILNFHSKFVSSDFKTCKADIKNKLLNAKNSIQKRKIEEMDEKEFQNDSIYPKYPKKSSSCSPKKRSYWEQYTSLKPYTIKSYSSLLPSDSLIPDLFGSNKSSCEVDPLSNLYCNNFLQSNPPTVKETCDIYKVQNLNKNFQLNINPINSHFREYNLMNNCKNIADVAIQQTSANDSSESMPNLKIHHQESIPFQCLPFSKSTTAVKPSKYIEQGKTNSTSADQLFTTAAGKSITISNDAMLAAQKLIQGIFQNETHQKTDRDAHCSPVENKQCIKVPALKRNCVISCNARNYKDDEITSEEIDSKCINNNHELDVCCDIDSVSFSTAAGKTISVSKTAMKAAHKLILNSFENENPSTSRTYNIGKNRSAFKDIGCPPKKLLKEDNDNTMDKALVENFFQDAVFDEEELEDNTEPSKAKDFNKVLESKKNNNPTACKIRKSLGGRRSMKFYSDI